MALGDDMRILGSLPGFKELEPDALRLIAFTAESRILRRGDVMFEEGETADAGFVLLSGSLAFQTGARDEAIAVQAPAVVGATALLTGTVRPARAIATELCATLRISRSLYRRVLGEYPDSAVRLRGAMANRLVEVNAELQHLRTLLDH